MSAFVAAHTRAGTHAAGGRRTQAASTTRLSRTDQQLVPISQNEHELPLSGQPEQEIHISSFGTLTKVNDGAFSTASIKPVFYRNFPMQTQNCPHLGDLTVESDLIREATEAPRAGAARSGHPQPRPGTEGPCCRPVTGQLTYNLPARWALHLENEDHET